MTEKDLFNAINDIDMKHIVNAWKNTENEPLAIESGKASKLKIFGIAAAFAAAAAAVCLVVYIRVNFPDSRTLIRHSPNDILPSDIHGPDGVRITYGDVTDVTDEYGKDFAADDITENNWQKITCDGFTYLSMPLNGENYNNIDDPSMFDGTSTVLRLDELSYTRWNVGDTFHGLTVKSASTSFQYHYKGTPTFTPKECSVEFDGTIPVDGYIMYDDNGELVCVPKSGGSFLPVIYPCEDLKFGNKGQYGDFKFDVVLPVFYLENDRAFDIDSILGDKGCAEVSLTVSDVRMCSMASMKSPNYIRAAIDGISEYVPAKN